MAVIASDGDTVTLCRNHEINGSGVAFGKAGSAYDKFGKGGCTNLVFNTRTAKLDSSWASLSGTVRNCAGGPTPWGTWLSCEETIVENGVRLPLTGPDLDRLRLEVGLDTRSLQRTTSCS